MSEIFGAISDKVSEKLLLIARLLHGHVAAPCSLVRMLQTTQSKSCSGNDLVAVHMNEIVVRGKALKCDNENRPTAMLLRLKQGSRHFRLDLQSARIVSRGL